MDTPFLYGRIAENENFTNRKSETEFLEKNFRGLINTIIISPRRWGKTSLVHKVAKLVSKENKDIIVCQVDIFNCRTEEEFYTVFANSLLKSTTTIWEEFVSGVKKYLGRLAPVVSISDATQTYELSFGIDFKDSRLSYDEILDLPQVIANDTKKKIVVCIDEFQNINEYEEPLAFQRKLRSHWQKHTSVCYCLYGSKRHMLLNIFNNYGMPFYKFGDILFLSKIERGEWVSFISRRFSSTGKKISDELSGLIADKMKNHPYYTQQLSQQVWFRTPDSGCTQKNVEEAFNSLIDQLQLFASIRLLQKKNKTMLKKEYNLDMDFLNIYIQKNRMQQKIKLRLQKAKTDNWSILFEMLFQVVHSLYLFRLHYENTFA